jgi:hypothetical protein
LAKNVTGGVLVVRLKPYHPERSRFLPVVFEQQTQLGTFEFAVHHLADGVEPRG